MISSTAKAQASRSEGFLWSDIKQMTIPGTCCRCFLPCILPILKWPSRSLGAGSHSVHEVICKDWGSIQGFKSTQNILNSLQLYSPEALDDIAQEGCNCLNIVLWPRMMTDSPPPFDCSLISLKSIKYLLENVDDYRKMWKVSWVFYLHSFINLLHVAFGMSLQIAWCWGNRITVIESHENIINVIFSCCFFLAWCSRNFHKLCLGSLMLL